MTHGLTFLVLSLTTTLVIGACPFEEEKVYYSDAVVFGTVKRLFAADSDGIQDMEFDVTCSYKGDVRSNSIIVTGVRNRMQIGGCRAFTLSEEEEVVLFLKNHPGNKPEYSIQFSPLQGESEIFLDELTTVCGLTLTTMRDDICFEPFELEDGCIEFVVDDEGEPGVVPILTDHNVPTSTSIRIRWDQPPTGGAPILKYKVKYQRVEVKMELEHAAAAAAEKGYELLRPIDTERVVDNIKNDQYELKGLLPDSFYMLTVEAKNVKGWGPPGTKIVKTADYVGEPGVVPILTDHNVPTSTIIRIRWDQPPTGGAPILKYKVKYQRVEVKMELEHAAAAAAEKGYELLRPIDTERVVDNIKNDQYELKGLLPDSFYMLTVEAKNVKGWGPPGTKIVKTADYVAPITTKRTPMTTKRTPVTTKRTLVTTKQTPSFIQRPAVDYVDTYQDSINVTWYYSPHSVGPIGAYHFISFRKYGGVEEWRETEKEETTEWWAVVSGLTPGTRYEIVVVAESADGTLESRSDVAFVTTRPEPTSVYGCRKLQSSGSWGFDEEKVYYSDAVVFGTVKRVFAADSDGIQDMEFEVTCSYKGDVRSNSIIVTGVGNRMQIGGCPAVSLRNEEEVVLFLKNHPGNKGGSRDNGRQPEYSIEYSPLRGYSDEFLDELTSVCGLTLTTRRDYVQCFEPLEDGECVEFVADDEAPVTTKRAPVTTKRTPVTTKRTPSFIQSPAVNFMEAYSDSINVTWYYSQRSDVPIGAYHFIRFRKYDGIGGWRETEKEATTEWWAVVSGLEPDTTYEIVVVAESADSTLETQSNVEAVTTRPERPGPVESARVVMRGSSHFLLEWKKTRPFKGILRGYAIQYQEIDGLRLVPISYESLSMFDDPDMSRAVIDKLHPDTEYRITIWARTTVVQGVPYILDAKTANFGGNLQKPTIGIEVLTEDAINVTWSVPQNSDTPAGEYHFVRFKKLGDSGQWRGTEKEALKSWATLSGLEPGTKYEIVVVAESADGTLQTTSSFKLVTTLGEGITSTPATSISNSQDAEDNKKTHYETTTRHDDVTKSVQSETGGTSHVMPSFLAMQLPFLYVIFGART